MISERGTCPPTQRSTKMGSPCHPRDSQAITLRNLGEVAAAGLLEGRRVERYVPPHPNMYMLMPILNLARAWAEKFYPMSDNLITRASQIQVDDVQLCKWYV